MVKVLNPIHNSFLCFCTGVLVHIKHFMTSSYRKGRLVVSRRGHHGFTTQNHSSTDEVETCEKVM